MADTKPATPAKNDGDTVRTAADEKLKAGSVQPGFALADPTGTISNRADGEGTRPSEPSADFYHANALITPPALQQAPNGVSCVGDTILGLAEDKPRKTQAELLDDATKLHDASVEKAVVVTQDLYASKLAFEDNAAAL
jgi:hypothetical protein